MSSAPHAGNPDRRALPDGWITRYDENYRAWYYVDTRAQPPRSSWDHPLGPLPPPPGNFQPPPNPPNRTYAGSGSSASFNQPQGQSYPAQPFNQEQSYTGGGYPGNQQNRTYQQPGFPPQQSYGGAAPANYGTPGWQGWQQPQPQGYPAQPQQTVQQPARGSGRGSMAPALLAGGAGLLGGALLAEGFEHHERREEEERREDYDQGFFDGQDNNDYSGGDY